jgi:glycosyltransferase involved in cell wall biosynthesis
VTVRRAAALRRFDRPAAGSAPAGREPAGTRPAAAGGGLRRGLGPLLRFPDRHNSWVPFALLEGLRAVAEEEVRVLLSSSPPVSGHLVAAALSACTGLPLVTDFRDLWTRNEKYAALKRPEWLAQVERALERKVLGRSRAVVTASETFTRTVRSQCEGQPERIFATVTNGIDRDDLECARRSVGRSEKFTIFHPGSLYGQRDPGFFFEVVERWLANDPARRDRIELLFVGDTASIDPGRLPAGLRDALRVEGHWPHARVLEQLWRSDLLLLLLGFDGAASGVIPAKLFEYIACRRPVLALVPPGEAAALIASTGAGEAVTRPDVERVVRLLEAAYEDWARGGPAPSDGIRVPPQLDRRLLAGRLAGVLDAVAGGGEPRRAGR